MKKFEWKDYATVRFKPKVPKPNTATPTGSCGTYAIHCITGVKIKEIEKHCPKKGWWDDASIRRFLKNHGYQTIAITDKLIQSSKPYIYQNCINHQHILLISVHSSTEEGTWEVAHNNRVYHGWEIEFFNGYEIIANPLWTAYLVWHPKWKTSEATKKSDCEGYWITHKGDGFIYHPMTGRWLNPDSGRLETPPSSLKAPRPDHSSGSAKLRRARVRGRS